VVSKHIARDQPNDTNANPAAGSCADYPHNDRTQHGAWLTFLLPSSKPQPSVTISEVQAFRLAAAGVGDEDLRPFP
jgi:hypothetical protein